MFALGLLSWLYYRPTEAHDARSWRRKFATQARDRRRPTSPAFKAGWNFGETTEDFAVSYEVKPAKHAARAPTATSPATWRWPTAWSRPRSASGLPLFLGAYPITPASDILHELSKHKRFGVTHLPGRGRDRRASARRSARRSAARSASPPTSGPGSGAQGRDDRARRSRSSCRWSSSTCSGPARRPGMPTKTEQADLLQAMFGRNGEAPVPIVAPRSPSDCFDAAIEAARIALTYRTPVILLSDGYLANGSEPWRLPESTTCPTCGSSSPPSPTTPRTAATFLPVPARPGDAGPAVGGARHAGPGAPHRRPREGRRHRQHLLRPGQPRPHGPHPAGQGRRRSPRRSRRSRSTTPSGEARVLVLGWGSTYGPIGAACRRVRASAASQVAQAHLRHLNPLPANLGEVLRALRQGGHPGDEPRPARACCIRGQLPGRRDRLQPGPRPAVHGRRARRSVHRGRAISDELTLTRVPAARPRAQGRATADGQGLQVRPGGALVPGLR